MQDLNVCLVQANLVWENRNENLKRLELLCTQKVQPGSCDLMLLPEMFNTGFSMKSELLAESMDGVTTKWMIKMAQQLDCQVGGTIIVRESESFYNRFIIASKSGITSFYDKRHLFRMAGENEHFSPGQQRVIYTLKGWHILLQICYDLRFPVFSRNKAFGDKLAYDAVIYLANWPQRRAHIWSVLLQARAIENQAYCIGVNRIGTDGNNISYSGNSAVIDPWGNVDYQATDSVEQVKILTLSSQKLSDIRISFPAYKDAD